MLLRHSGLGQSRVPFPRLVEPGAPAHLAALRRALRWSIENGRHCMRLTNFSDYALRVLMYAAARDGERITIEETAQRYGISRTHLMKVVNLLTRAGYLK